MKFLSYFFTFLLFSAPTFSAVLYGEVRGDLFQWRTMGTAGHTGHFQTEGDVTAFWDLPSALPAAQAWIPGGKVRDAVDIIFTGPNGAATNIMIRVNILGIQYKSSDFNSASDLPSGNEVYYHPTDRTFSVAEKGMGDLLIELNDEGIAPFTHIRPMLRIDDSQMLINAFKDLPNGLYQGSAFIRSQYDYYRVYDPNNTGNNIKIRNTNVQKITIQIRNYRNKLNQIAVLGSDLMQTQYSQDKTKVSAETIYTVVTRGYFSNGVSVKLQPSRNSYALTHDSGEGSINYSAKCIRGCDEENYAFIEDGIGKTNQKTKIKTIDYESAVAEIGVTFPEQKVSNLKQGRYSGAFTLIFELNV